ncbi:MAG: MATE family efflux transporter [Oscillospiraceae bacterium]|nr:MATE family efflux transporter [Oscillospiraceae bacterium]
MDQQDAKFHKMTEAPVRGLIFSLAIPCIISMLVTAFYNMADTYFVGMLKSNAATGAVGVVFSMMAVIQAVGFFFGQGGGVYISQMMGRQDYREASNMAATSFVYALATGGVICILGQIFLEPLAYLLGSTETILPYTEDYLRVILLGAPWMAASLVLNNQLRFQGSASYAMVGIVAGAVLNIALDPILIFTLGMGIAGAGWATIVSQFVSFCLLLAGCTRGENIRIHLRNVKIKWFYFHQIIRGGLPSLSRQILASLATICLNNAARPYGDAAIAAMGVVQRIMMFGASTMLGFGQGFQPVCGINFGAQRYDRVKEGFWFCVRFSTVFLALAGTAGAVFAPQLIALFRDDPAVIEFGAAGLRFQCATFWMHGWIVMSNMMQQSTGQTLPATFNSVARQGLFFIPCVLILPFFLNELGLQMAQSVADAASFLIAIPIQLIILRRLKEGTLKRPA